MVVCNAPIVEGAVIAATEASGGASLATVRRTAEELSRMTSLVGSAQIRLCRPRSLPARRRATSGFDVTQERDFRMNDMTATASVPLTNSIGLHARPSVKLTKLAKTFAAISRSPWRRTVPWVDAKSIVKVMAVKAAKGAVLHFRAKGDDARRRRSRRCASSSP